MSRLARPFSARALLAAPVLLGLLVAPLSARPERQPRKVAFLIGVEKYRHAFDPALFAERDVRELARALAGEWEVVVLTGEDATRANIDKRLEMLIEGQGKGGRLRQGDVILVSLNGHGLQMKLKEDTEDAFFCPVDAVLGKPETMLSLSRLVDDKLGPLGSRNLILVDACRNDPNPNRGTRGLEGHGMKLPPNTAILFGCGRGEKSHGGKAGDGHGLFTYPVLKGLRGGAARDGEVSWADLVSHVQRTMRKDEEIKRLLDGARQTPILASGELPDTVLLVHGWVKLFNGKDLTGWKTHPNNPGDWRVEEGVLVGRGGRSHLFSERGDYENFQFRIEAMINDKGNSGQYFRTEFGPGLPTGYEAQICSTQPGQVKTGSLIGIVRIDEQLHKPDEWFTQEVIANGNHIVIKVNDKVVVDTNHARYSRGHFALQHHDAGTVVKFRKIEVKELPPSKE